MQRLMLFFALASCAPADADTLHGVHAACMDWPRELQLTLPADEVAILDWHDKNKARWRVAHDDCRDALRKLVRAVNSGKTGT